MLLYGSTRSMGRDWWSSGILEELLNGWVRENMREASGRTSWRRPSILKKLFQIASSSGFWWLLWILSLLWCLLSQWLLPWRGITMISTTITLVGPKPTSVLESTPWFSAKSIVKAVNQTVTIATNDHPTAAIDPLSNFIFIFKFLLVTNKFIIQAQKERNRKTFLTRFT